MTIRPAVRRADAQQIELEHRRNIARQVRQARRKPEEEKKEAQQLENSRKSLKYFLKLEHNPLSREREKGYDWIYDNALKPAEVENLYLAAKECADYEMNGDEEQLQKWNEFTIFQKQLIHLIIDKYNEGAKETETEAEGGKEQKEVTAVEAEKQARRVSWIKLKPILEELGVAAGADSQAVYDVFTDEQIQEFYPAAQAIFGYKNDGNEKHLKEWNGLTEEQQKLIRLVVDSYQGIEEAEDTEETDGDEAAA
jgi:hypothetical protein